MGGDVRYELRGAAAWVIIDHEDQRNALSPEVVAGLHEAIGRIGADDAVRVAVFTGAGERAFSAGGHLGGMTGEHSRVAQHDARGALVALFRSMQECPTPIVARVNGHALAGGFGLMLACDLAIAADDAELGTPEINLGLWPYMISAVIQRNVPRKIALDMMLTGRRVTAEDAGRWGMVNRVVPRPDLDGAVEAMVTELASKSPLILALGKRSFYRSQDMSFEDALAYLHAMLTVNLESEDVAEGVNAFLQKRSPEWKGR
ncbi:MAG TPA: enoyl-CoA hydratase-related protein [Actinomycetota bacterium]|jgi:enoyl-CoA hydratase/carnithine racemase